MNTTCALSETRLKPETSKFNWKPFTSKTKSTLMLLSFFHSYTCCTTPQFYVMFLLEKDLTLLYVGMSVTYVVQTPK